MGHVLTHENEELVGIACLSDHVITRLREKNRKPVAQQHIIVGHGHTRSQPRAMLDKRRAGHSASITELLPRLALAPMRHAQRRFSLNRMPLRLLLVDDSPGFLEIARTLLEQEGATVIGVARSLDDAKREARTLRPDVTLVDIDMPAMSGFDVVRELSESGDAGRLILVSAHAPEEFAEMIESSPAICFISKAELSVEAIERCLAQARSERAG